MDLLERYLQAVQFWLPKKQRQDIIAELSEDLRSQIEEKEAGLGRKLGEGELEEILKRCGAPLVVASRYRAEESLIGPVLFPLYRFVLGVALLGCVVPRLLVWLGFWIFDPDGRPYLDLDKMLTTVVALAFAITLAFAILERTGAKARLLESWNPRRLPAVSDPNRISRAGSLIELAMSGILLVWFVGVFWPGKVIDFAGPTIVLAPVWKYFFWAFVVLAVINIQAASANFIRPYWTPLRAAIRAANTLIGGLIFAALMKAQVLASFSAPGVTAERARELTNLINLWTGRSAGWAFVGFAVIFCFDVYRIVRLRRLLPLDREMGVVAGT